MSAKVCWLLNLDAELELADPDGYRRSRRMAQQIAKAGPGILQRMGELEPGEQRIVWHPDLELDGSWRGSAWCPTPSALQALGAVGARVEPAPELAVLQRVNHRRFAAEVASDRGCALPGARYVDRFDELERMLAVPSIAGPWMLKRPFGFSGRWRKRVEGPLTDAQETWARASMHSYGIGLMVEPCVDIECEFATHGHVAPDGSVQLRSPILQVVDERGSWQGARHIDAECPPEQLEALCDAAEAVAKALHRSGYHGPFSVDSYRWGGGQLQVLSEINARWSMAAWGPR